MARKLEVQIVGDASSLHRALSQSESGWKKWAKAGAVAGVAAGVTSKAIDLLGEGITSTVHATLDAQKQNARLGVAFKSAGLNAAKYHDQLDKVESQSRKLGFTDEDVKQSLGSLLVATKSYTASAKQLGIAQNLARFKSVSLEQATKALTMAHAGSLRPIKQLGLDIPKVTDAVDALKASTKKHSGAAYENALAVAKIQDKSSTYANVLKAVTGATKGQADAFSKTASGAMEQFKAQLVHIEVQIGNKLLPLLEKAIQWFMKNWPQISAVMAQVWANIKPILQSWADFVGSVVGLIRKHWGTIGPILIQVKVLIQRVLDQIKTIFKIFGDLIRGDWSALWTDLKHLVSNMLAQAVGIIRLEIDVFFKIAKALGEQIWRGIKAGFEAGAKALEGAIKGLFGKVIHWAEEALGIASPSQVFHDIGRHAIQGFINGVGSMAGLLKKAVVGVAKSAAHHLEGLIPGFGGPGKVKAGKGGSTLGTLIPWANEEGMTVTSTTGGDHVSGSWHYKGRAIDVAGSAGQMRKFFFDSLEHFGIGQIKELFYDPVGEYVKNGSLIRGQIGGHSDHVHLALGKGGIVTRPTMALIGEKGPEAVIPLGRNGGGSQTIQLVLPDGRMVAEWLLDPLRNAAQVRSQRTGRPTFG